MTRSRKGSAPAKRRRTIVEVPAFDLKIPSPVRIVDHALAVQGWSVTARRRILRAIKDGSGDAPFVHSDQEEAGLTGNRPSPNSDVTHVKRCECQGVNPDAVWTTGMSSAADPIDK
jgi:hypothetical protein